MGPLRLVPPLAALVLAGSLLGLAAGGSLYDGDESVYGEFARGVREGDPLTLAWQGQPVHQRPPLFVWALAASTAALGERELALRLPVLLAAGLGVLGAGLLGRRLGRLAGLGPDVAGAAAALVQLALGLTWWHGLLVESDILLGALAVLAVERYAAWLELAVVPAPAEPTAQRRRRALVGFAVLAGLCALTKQVAGLLPLAALLVAPRRPRRGEALAAGAAFLLVTAPWHIVQLARFGGAFVDGYLGFNVVARAARSFFAPTPWWYYGRVLWHSEGALGLGLLGAALAAGVVLAARPRPGALGFRLGVGLPALALVVVSLPATRIDYYLLAVTPLLAAACGLVLARVPRWPLAAAVACAALIAASHRGPRLAPRDPAPAQKLLARRAVELGAARLVVVDLQPSAARFYGRLPTTRLVVGEPWRARRLRGIDIFAVPGAIADAPDAAAACASGILSPPALLLAHVGAGYDALRGAGCVAEELAASGKLVLARGR